VQDTDYPKMIIYNFPLEGFDESGITNELLVKKELIKSVKDMEKFGSSFIVIPCNTVHVFYEDMVANINIPILSIIDATIDYIKKYKYRCVGVLSSNSTKKMNIYTDKLINENIKSISTNIEEQKMIDSIILKVMSGTQSETDILDLKNICNRMTQNGAEVIVLGCTELPLAITQNDIPEIDLIDTIQILVEKSLKEIHNNF